MNPTGPSVDPPIGRLQAYSYWLIAALFFLGIGLSGSVNHTESSAWWGLTFLGLWFGWPAWHQLRTLEKVLILGWIGILAGAGISFINTDNVRSGHHDLEKFLRFAVAGPLYLTLRRYGWPMTKAVLTGSLVGVSLLLIFGVVQIFFQGVDRAHGNVYPITYGDITILFALIIFVSGACLYRRKRDLFWIALGIGGVIASILSKTSLVDSYDTTSFNSINVNNETQEVVLFPYKKPIFKTAGGLKTILMGLQGE